MELTEVRPLYRWGYLNPSCPICQGLCALDADLEYTDITSDEVVQIIKHLFGQGNVEVCFPAPGLHYDVVQYYCARCGIAMIRADATCSNRHKGR